MDSAKHGKNGLGCGHSTASRWCLLQPHTAKVPPDQPGQGFRFKAINLGQQPAILQAPLGTLPLRQAHATEMNHGAMPQGGVGGWMDD